MGLRAVAGRLATALFTTLALSGCVTFSQDGGMSLVRDVTSRGIGKDAVAIRSPDESATARARVSQLLARVLTVDAAVQVALLNNRGLQAAYNELASAEARMVQGSLPPNPTFSLSRVEGSAEIEIERKIVANILALATLPARAEVEGIRFRQAQLKAAEETLRIAAEARRAYYRAVAARERARFLTQANTAADTTAKLSVRLGQTGALNKLDQAREQVFYAELTAQLATSRQREASDREALIRVLGLWGGDLDFKLPSTLPTLPARPKAMASIEVEAVRRRVDLQIARMELDALAKSFGLTQATRFISMLDAGFASKTTKEKATGEIIRDRGIEVEFQIPLFDFGEARLRQAEASYMQAVNRLEEKAVNVRSEARNAYRGYRSAYDIARHYQREVLPLRKIISDETLLRYNAMLIDVFALIAEARERTTANTAAIEAKQNFWLADTDLGAAITGGGQSTGSEQASQASAQASSAPAEH